MDKKGMIFTIDAILAVVIAGIMLSAAYFYISDEYGEGDRQQNLYKISLDILSALEKDGALQNSVNAGSASSIGSFLNALPTQICSNVTIYDNSSIIRASAQKQNCNITQPVFSRRVFVSGNFSAYYAEAKLDFS